MARALKEAMPVEAHAALDRMAERIARNREVLAVHYPSDSTAGKDLAAQAFPLLDAGPMFRALKAEAKVEWADEQGAG